MKKIKLEDSWERVKVAVKKNDSWFIVRCCTERFLTAVISCICPELKVNICNYMSFFWEQLWYSGPCISRKLLYDETDNNSSFPYSIIWKSVALYSI